MNVDALNDRDLLDDTPLGDLVVVQMRGFVGVGVVDRHDPEKPPRIIHVVEPNKARGTVLDALYGKHFWAQKAVQKLYTKAQEQLDVRIAREEADQGKSFREGMRRWLQREGARDLLQEATAWR
jgi:hypothetical protein